MVAVPAHDLLEQPPAVAAQQFLADPGELVEQHVPGGRALLDGRPGEHPGVADRQHGQVVDPAGHQERVHPGDGRAPVVADHVRAADAELGGERDDVVDDRLHAVRLDLLRLGGVAEAAQVGRDHPEPALGERRDLVPPQVGGVGVAVQQDDGVALALVHVGDVDVVDAHRLLLGHAVS